MVGVKTQESMTPLHSVITDFSFKVVFRDCSSESSIFFPGIFAKVNVGQFSDVLSLV